MADNNIGKPLTMVEKVTEPDSNANIFINDNGKVHQAAVNDVLKNSDINTSLKSKTLLKIYTSKNGYYNMDATYIESTAWTSFIVKTNPNSAIILSGITELGGYVPHIIGEKTDGTKVAIKSINNGTISGNYVKYYIPIANADLDKVYIERTDVGNMCSDLMNDTYDINTSLVSKIGFIDTSNVIVQKTTVTSNTEYTATQDCYFIVATSQTTDKNDWVGVKLTINNHMIWEILTKTAKDGCAYSFPLKKGQTINIEQDGIAMIDNVTYKVLGMI